MASDSDLSSTETLLVLGRHAAHLVHDWNNVLTLLAAQCEELDGEPAEELRRTVAEAAALPRQLLAYLRGQEGHRRALVLDDWLREAEPALRQLAGRRTRFLADYDAPGATIQADAGALRNALFNLVLNARAALGEAGRIRLETRTTEAGVTLTIRDNGRGMDPATQARIFEPYFTAGGGPGRSGLGLASVQSFANDHGVAITVESAEGAGAAFVLRFPAVAEAAAG